MTTYERYQLVERWSSTNQQSGWVVWDTERDRPASGWHRDQHHLARCCDVLNGAGETQHEDYLIEAFNREFVPFCDTEGA